LYAAFSSIQDAPRDLKLFRNKFGSLRFVVNEIARFQAEAPADVFSDRLMDALADVEAPLCQDVVALQSLLDKTKSMRRSFGGKSNTSLHQKNLSSRPLKMATLAW
jgi:hypothetical protein